MSMLSTLLPRRFRLPRSPTSVRVATLLAGGEVRWDEGELRPFAGDDATLGGLALALLADVSSEVMARAAAVSAAVASANGHADAGDATEAAARTAAITAAVAPKADTSAMTAADAVALASARAYADAGDAGEATARDAAISAAVASKANTSAMTAADAATLTSAQTYADAAVFRAIASGRTYADAGDAAEATARNTAIAAAVAPKANTTDLTAEMAARTLADTATLSAAKTYADAGDAAEVTARTAAIGAAVGPKANASDLTAEAAARAASDTDLLRDRRAPQRYSVYQPSYTRAVVQDGGAAPGGYTYNHTPALARFDGRWFALWSANSTQQESLGGQVILQKSAVNFGDLGAATAVRPFVDAGQTDTPVPVSTTGIQWQPGLAVVNGALWAVWHQETLTPGIYFSKLSSGTGKWVTTLLPVLPYTRAGTTYQIGFVAGDLLQLASGRVLAPVALISTTRSAPSLPAGQTGGDLRYKMVGVIYTDDGGATWAVGGMTAIQGEPWAAFEPALTVQPDGSVRLFARSFSTGVLDPHDQMLTAVSLDDGQSFGPLLPTGLDCASSRSALVTRDPTTSPSVLIQNDQRRLFSNSVGVLDRRSLSGYLGFGGGDHVPGFAISDDDLDVAACYPSALTQDGKLYALYSTYEGLTSGFSSTIKSVVIDPAPPSGAILLRRNARRLMSPAIVTAPYRAFDYRPWSAMRSVGTMAAADADNQSFAALFTTIGGPIGTIMDTRPSTAGGSGVLLKAGATVIVGIHRDATYLGDYTTTLTIPRNEEVMVYGVVNRAAGTVMVGLVRKDGSVTTQTVNVGSALTALNGTNTVCFGCAKAGSTLGSVSGISRVRRIAIFSGALTTNQFRAIQQSSGVAIGMTAWAGAADAPPTAFMDLDAANTNADTNATGWTALFTPTAQREGYADTTTDGTTPVVRLYGSASAGIAPSVRTRAANHYTFRYKAVSGRTVETGICTVGADNASLVLTKTAAGAISLQLSPGMGSTAAVTLAAAAVIPDDAYYAVHVLFGPDRVTIAHEGIAPITVRYSGRPLVFLGAAWTVATTTDVNVMLYDISSIVVKNAVLDESAYALTDLGGAAIYDPPSLAAGASATTTLAVPGAVPGNYVDASFSLDLQGITLSAWASAANVVSVRLTNGTGGVIDLASGTLRASVRN